MAYAGDLGGAFFIGQGVHGYVKPDGCFMDDIWFYDANGHRWICLYPGTDTNNFIANVAAGELKLNDEGQLVDKAGRLVPFSAVAGHSYQDHVYNPDTGEYLFGGHGDGIGSEQHVRDKEWCKRSRELLLAQSRPDKSAGAPFAFNTVAGRFERAAGRSAGRAHGGAGGSFMVDLVYLPTKKTYWQHSQGVVRLADPVTLKWTDVKTSGTPPPGGDVGVCYDSKRDRVYMCGAAAGKADKNAGCVFIYDVKTAAWSNPPDRGKAPAGLGSANRSCVHYDSASDRVVVIVFYGPKETLGVYVFDPETATWSDAALPPPPAFAADQRCGHGFYWPELNAHLLYRAADSNDAGTMWAYRYKKPAAR